jgi:hypothetical protein
VLTIDEYRVTAKILADRLDLMGFSEANTLAMLSGALAADRALGELGIVGAVERALVRSLTAKSWVDNLRDSTDYLPGVSGPDLRSREWLLSLINGMSFMRRLRAILMAFPEVDVVLDRIGPDRPRAERVPAWNSAQATEALRHEARAYSPTVVLTEGSTDAEFLGAALALLYPHLTDLIRFLDYDQKAEGGAGALTKMLRAFSAAGVTNRLVAVFDNDTAAAEALRGLDQDSLAPHIEVLRYPNLKLAEGYPTLGPPGPESPAGSVSLTNINGLAASIELYLGIDVLTQDNGQLCPVQWTSYSTALRQYHGQITNKRNIQNKFRSKYRLAMEDPAAIRDGDWSGLTLIIDAIRAAAQLAQDTPSD